jgi:hypothetical protein
MVPSFIFKDAISGTLTLLLFTKITSSLLLRNELSFHTRIPTSDSVHYYNYGSSKTDPSNQLRIPDFVLATKKLRQTVMVRSSSSSSSSYYGESESSFMIQEFSTFESLENIVKLAAKPLPERPDGIVTVAKFTSVSLRDTEAEYERLARAHPSTIFLRAFAEYKDADILFAMAQINTLPTFDIFYGGNRVGRVEGLAGDDLEKYIVNYGFINSKLDLFSEESDNQRRLLAWGDGRVNAKANKSPRTTGRFIPGYDWDKSKGFFDDLGDKMIQDFENTYGNWLPPTADDDVKK